MKTKIIYLDVMIGEKFICQFRYKYSSLFKINKDEMRDYVLSKRPSLKNKDFRVELSHNRVC